MAEKSILNQTIALAGMFQACEQVREIAYSGRYNADMLETAIHSLMQLESNDIEDIYGGFHNLSRGSQVLQKQLGGEASGRDIEITRNVATLLHLERNLMNNASALKSLRSAMEAAISQAQYFDNTHENVISNIADIYKTTISPLGSKVIVNGEQQFLADESKAKLIRVFLLAALRSAVLWRQCGGNRFKLIMQRTKHIQAAKQINPLH